MARFTGTGQGAAPCTTTRSVEVSWPSRTSSGRASSRWNMVGTRWVWVTPWRSTRARNSAASHRSIITTGTPIDSGGTSEIVSGAAW